MSAMNKSLETFASYLFENPYMFMQSVFIKMAHSLKVYIEI